MFFGLEGEAFLTADRHATSKETEQNSHAFRPFPFVVKFFNAESSPNQLLDYKAVGASECGTKHLRQRASYLSLAPTSTRSSDSTVRCE